MEKTVYDRKLLRSRNRDVINFEFFRVQTSSRPREEETMFEFSVALQCHLQWPQLQASSSPIPRIRIRPIVN